MANVGEKTGKKTQAGRDVYKTPEGKMVSEKSTTFEYKGKWINIPTIHDGKQYSQDQLINMLDKGLIKPTSTHNKLEEAVKAAKSRSKSLKFNEGGLADQTLEAFGQPNKGLSWGELIVDNILGLDNEYESFGEKLGKAINEDEIKFLKDAAIGVYEGTKEFVQAPVETTKQVVNEIKDSVTRLGSEDLNTRLQRMYNVTYEQATDEQVNQAREAVLGDALTALELVPAAKVTTTVAGAAIPSGLKADVVGQTKAMLSGDREFLSATPTNRATTQSLSAGFTGQNPPTYLKRDVPLSQQNEYELDYFNQVRPTEKKNLSNVERVAFREPIKEFTEKLIFTSSVTNSFPKKGMLGSEFLKLLEKNAESIPPSSYKEGLVDKNKRYTQQELLDAVTKGENSRRGDNFPAPPSLYYSRARLEPSNAYSQYQRQSDQGFRGGVEPPNGYFVIPIEGFTKGTDFKANSQHFGGNTIAHVRGSIVDPMVGWNNNPYLSEDFKNIVGKNQYVLVEEIQSDLLQKGFVKPKDAFETAFAATVRDFNNESPFTFNEAYGDATKEFKNLFKKLDKIEEVKEPQRLMNVYSPNNNVFNRKKEYDLIRKIKERDRTTSWNDRKINKGYVTFKELKDYIDEQGANDQEIWNFGVKLEADRRNGDWFNFEVVDEKTGKVYDDLIVDFDNENFVALTEDFTKYMKGFGLDKESILDKYENDIEKFYTDQHDTFINSGLSKDIPEDDFFDLYHAYKYNKEQVYTSDDVALPPIRKNKQAVEESLKTIILKAAKEGIDKIVIPPAEKIAQARRRVIDPNDKGDRFYRTYVTDLNQVLDELSQNYPVTVHRDIELPYENPAQPTRTNMVEEAVEDFTVEEGDEFFDLPEGFFDDVPDQDAPVQQPKTKAEPVNHKGTIIDISKLIDEYRVEEPRQFAEGGSIRPKLRPEGFANATSPKPRLRPSGNEVRYLDAVFRGEDGDIVTSPEENNPVTMLGLTRGDTFRQYPKDNLNVKGLYFIPTDEGEGGPTESKMQDFYSREKPDSPPLLIDDILIAGRRGVEDRYTAAHEFMHRGFNVLRSNHSFDEVKERFGRATAQILFSERADLEHALVQAVLEKEGKVAGIDYEGYDYLKGASKETRDKLKKSIEDIYELSNETLGEAGYQTDRDRGPTTRQGRRGAKPKSFWSFITEKLGFAEGGAVGNMNQQMSFAFADGGLRDDGMREDPVSGNEVPAGSMAEEVRDDIPAQLSEGEYVVPADVVRYYGVKFFEDLRDAAKMGLQDMEARGRIGGEPVPEGGPTNDDDLTPEELAAIQEMMGMSEGGVVGYQTGGLQTDQDFLAAGQQAQQNQFTGFPLGATIFPRAESGEIESVPTTPTPAPTITVQETAESCARKGMSYDPATQTCVAMPVQAPVQTGGSSNDGPPPPPPESKPWYEGVDWTTTDIADPTAIESIIQQVPGVGQIVSMRNIAGQYAKANILEAAGDIKSANQIRDNIEEYIGKQSLATKIAQDAFGRYADGDWMTIEYLNSIGIETPKGLKTEDGGGMPEFIKELANDPTKRALIAGSISPERKQLIDQSVATEEAKRVAAAKAAEEAAAAAQQQAAENARRAARSLSNRGSNADNAAQLAAIQKAQKIAQKAADAGTSIAAQTQTGSGGYGSASSADKPTGGQGSVSQGSGWGGMNEGGLMSSKPKNKTKRQYKKGGLAGKK